MKELYTFYSSKQGYSHLKKESLQENKEIGRLFPCQDASFADFVASDYSHKVEYYLCCVCDGHGGSAYFRSGTGAQFAISAIKEAVRRLIDKIIECNNEQTFREQLQIVISEIVRIWKSKVDIDLKKYPITEKEMLFLKSEDNKALEKYLLGQDLYSIYGSTALAFIYTGQLWIAFQIGDGDIAIKFENSNAFNYPIPEDKNIFLNQTTSICDENSEKEFRIAYGKDKVEYVICSTDGISNSFSNQNQLFNFYDNIYWLFKYYDFDEDDTCENIKNRVTQVQCEIEKSLPEISKKGSGDDVSIAGFVKILDEDLKSIRERHEIKSKADSGNVECLMNMANFYASHKKFKEAVYFVIKAAEQGLPEAECKLGKCYRDGRGLEKNEELSIEWYKKAALHNNQEAILYLNQNKIEFNKVELQNKESNKEITDTFNLIKKNFLKILICLILVSMIILTSFITIKNFKTKSKSLENIENDSSFVIKNTDIKNSNKKSKNR